MIRQSWKEFVEKLKDKKFEPLPKNIFSSDDYEEERTKRFKEEYECTWVKNSQYDRAYYLCAEYYYETEKYDREICSFINEHDEAIPINCHENELVQKNSIAWWKYINLICDREQIDKETWNSARKDACRLSWNGLQKWNERRYIK